ncbi:MAG: hypothetical protein O2960_02960, partial [Verrucomicrobia bacterium]|nr:hypothetical protein [Verrucomicrobiota bacterium]
MLRNFSGSRASGGQAEKESEENQPADSENSVEETLVVGGIAANPALMNLMLPQLAKNETRSGVTVPSVEILVEPTFSGLPGLRQKASVAAGLKNAVKPALVGEPSGILLKVSPVSVTEPESASQTQLTPSQTQPTPSQAQPTPSQTQPTPSQTQPTPSQTQLTPSQAQPTPSQTQPTPSQTQPTP